MDVGSISTLHPGDYQSGRLRQSGGEANDVSAMRRKSHRHSSHEHGSRAERHGKSHTSNILRQEIRLALSTSFRISFSATLPAYAANAGEQTPADVATDTLGAARQLAANDPLAASNTLVSLRGRVEQAASSVRETLGDGGHEAVNEIMSEVNRGLDVMDDNAARNVPSSASVLSVETSLRQRSTIRIRTQEGDIVRLDLRRSEQMSATDVSVTQGDTVATSTAVEISSRTRGVLRVEGDLNEAELAAIQNVFAQAEAIADEFFGGDLAAAFDMAAGLEFDAEQLSKVNMRFRERQVSTISYASLQAGAQQPVIEKTPPSSGTPGPVKPAELTGATEPSPTPDVPPTTTVAETEVPAATPAIADDAIDGLAALLANFMRVLNEGFESGSFRFHYSESFKLEILKSVLQVSAPDDSDDAANAAATAIDAVMASAEDEPTVGAGS